ncbi:MAG: uracil-DNA glycosylase family protein [Candidatus Woesearchaeota archaeon]
MQVKQLFPQFDELQQVYGDKTLDAICGCGNIKNPDIFLVFMNPTGKNVSSNKSWKGIKAPWLGTKNVWRMLYQLGLFDELFVNSIKSKKPFEWDYAFAESVYKKVSDNSVYITNLSKATQSDARHLSNDIFRKYLELLKSEIDYIKPKIIISFGNQVSSILLGKNIKISDYRKKYELLTINGKFYKVFPVYYPVGQGTRNLNIAKEDILWIMKNHLK